METKLGIRRLPLTRELSAKQTEGEKSVLAKNDAVEDGCALSVLAVLSRLSQRKRQANVGAVCQKMHKKQKKNPPLESRGDLYLPIKLSVT